jgi:hypothetical protein
MRAITVRRYGVSMGVLLALAFGLFGIGAPTGVAAASRELYSATVIQPYCDGDTPVGADLQYNNPRLGFTLSTDASGYTIPGGGLITLIATLNDPVNDTFAISGGNWIDNGDGTATLTESFGGITCGAAPTVDLYNPTPVQASCDGATAIAPSFTYNFATVNLSFSTVNVDWTSATGGTVRYVATPAAGYELAIQQTGVWVLQDDGTAFFDQVFAGIPCGEAPNVDLYGPTPVYPDCEGGDEIAPSFSYAYDATNLTFAVTNIDWTAATGGTMRYTVTPAAGYELDLMSNDSWVLQEDGSAIYDFPFEGIECFGEGEDLPVMIFSAGYNPPSCKGTDAVAPSFYYLEGTWPTDNFTLSQDISAWSAETGGPIVYTATADDGYFLRTHENSGWVIADDGYTATWTLSLDGIDCTPDAPLSAPTIFNTASCSDGVLNLPNPAWQIVEFDGVDVAADVPADGVGNGTTITFTFTLQEGFYFPEAGLPDWLTQTGETTATYAVTYRALQCTSLPTPVVSDVTCLDGAQTIPSFASGDAEGYVIEESGTVAAGETVTLVASPMSDAVQDLVTIPAGWIAGDDDTYVYTFTFADPDCSLPVATPARPIIVDVSCNGPVQTAPEITLVSTDGLAYELDDPAAAGNVAAAALPGSTVTVYAHLEDGWAFPDVLPDGWLLVDDTTAAFTFTFANPVCTEDPNIIANPPGSGAGDPDDQGNPDGDGEEGDGDGTSGSGANGLDDVGITGLPSTGAGSDANQLPLAAIVAAMSLLALGGARWMRRA